MNTIKDTQEGESFVLVNSSSKPSTINLEEWLEINKLTHLSENFKNRKVTIDELTDFTEDELKDFAKDLGLDTLEKRRFVNGILNVGKNKKNNQTLGRLKMSKEMIAKKLKTQITLNLENVNNKDLINNYYSKLDKIFNEIQSNLDNKKELLKNNIDKMLKDKNSLLNQQNKMLENKDYNFSVTKGKVDIIYQKDFVDQFLGRLVIDSCDVPNAPELSFKKVSAHDSFDLIWIDPETKLKTRRILEYEIFYYKYKKLKRQKRKKKRRKKKTRKKDSSTDSSSDSDSDSSSSDSDDYSDSESDSESDKETEKEEKKENKEKKTNYGTKIGDLELSKLSLEDKKWKKVSLKTDNPEIVFNEKKNTKEYRLNKLKLNTQYLIRMRSKNINGYSLFSNLYSISTLDAAFAWKGGKCKRSKKIGKVSFKKRLKIEFDLIIHARSGNQWENILHVGSIDQERSPGVWLYGNSSRIHFRFSDTASWNTGYDPNNNLSLNKKHKISFVYKNNTGVLTVDKQVINTKSNVIGIQRHNAPIYVSDPWYVSANCTVKNLRITT